MILRNNMEYISILTIFAIVPSLFFLFFVHNVIDWKAFIVSALLVAALGIVADYIGLNRGLWFFNHEEGRLLGVWFWGVPIEDFIFVITVPVLVISAYEFIKKNLRTWNLI